MVCYCTFVLKTVLRSTDFVVVFAVGLTACAKLGRLVDEVSKENVIFVVFTAHF